MDETMSSPGFDLNVQTVPSFNGALPASSDAIQEELWNSLTEFYSQNEETIEQCARVDVREIAKTDKMQELDFQIDRFVQNGKVVLDGLVALGNVHPVIGAAVFAFHGVISLDLARRDNNRKVLAIKLQMQNMMCAMFQLRTLKHFHVQHREKERERAHLHRLIKAIADDITQCGSDINYYTDRKFISKMTNAKTFERRFQGHIEIFSQRRSELQTTIAAYVAAGVDAANVAIAELATTINVMHEKLDRHVVAIFRKLDTPREKEVLKFLEQNGGAEKCILRDELLTKLLSTAGDVLPPDPNDSMSFTDRLAESRKILKAELDQNLDDVLKQNLQRFEKLLTVQNNNMERLSDQIEGQGQYLRDGTVKLDKLSILILEEGKLIRKAIGSNFAINIKDPQLQEIWDAMGLKRSVKAKNFVLTFRDHLLSDRSTPSTPYTQTSATVPPERSLSGIRLTVATNPAILSSKLKAESEPDLWLLQYIDVTHVRQIVEAMDEDRSGFISVKEANKFALSRPKEFSLLQWIVYWAAGWHVNITNYRSKIYAILLQMYEMLPSIHPANRAYVDDYLNDFAIRRVEALLRSTKEISDKSAAESKLVDLAKSFAAMQERRLTRNLKEVSYVITSPANATLVAGSTRIESWIYPLLYLTLNRHLAVVRLSKTHILHEKELHAHSESLSWIFHVFDERMQSLAAIFSQVHQNVTTQFETFAYGIFLTSYKKETEMVPAKNTLVMFRDTTVTENTLLNPVAEASDVKNMTFLVCGEEQPFTFEFPKTDRCDKPSSVDDHGPHPIEGYWSGICLRVGSQRVPFKGLLYGVFEPIQEQKIIGCGDTYCGTIEFDGEITDTGESYANLEFKMRWQTGLDIWCKGRYDSAKDSIQGNWKLAGDSENFPDAGDWNDDSNDQPRGSFYFTRTPAELYRFRGILTSPEYDSTWNLAQRRWAFAIEAVLYQVQGRRNSQEFWRSRMKEKNDWIEFTIRHYLDEAQFRVTRGYLTAAEENKLLDLIWQIHPTRGRIYESLSQYLYARQYHSRGRYNCASCNQRIVFSRYQCIYCIKEDLSDQLNFCVEEQCVQSRAAPIGEFEFLHHPSHTLLRSINRIHDCELATMIPQTRLRSERVKSAFRALQAKAKSAQEDVKPTRIIDITKSSKDVDPDITTIPIPSQSHPLICVCCKKEATLPCWVCVTCALDTVVCLECELKRVRVPKNDESALPHSHNHPLLRIQDSVAFVSHEKKGSRLEQQLEGINSELVSLEQKVQARLNKVESGMKTALETLAKASTQKEHRLYPDHASTSATGHQNESDGAVSTPQFSDTVSRDSRVDIHDREIASQLSSLEKKFGQTSSGHEDLRVAALETKFDERMSKLEAKVDDQFGLVLSLLQQLVSSTSAPVNQDGDSTS